MITRLEFSDGSSMELNNRHLPKFISGEVDAIKQIYYDGKPVSNHFIIFAPRRVEATFVMTLTPEGERQFRELRFHGKHLAPAPAELERLLKDLEALDDAITIIRKAQKEIIENATEDFFVLSSQELDAYHTLDTSGEWLDSERFYKTLKLGDWYD
jgi:hypothetical protein